jgi:uncharacterized membrane protein YphA (DoxX/SURF4 family)
MTVRALSSALAFLAPVAVGSVLLFAGLTKALEPSNFVRHLKNLGLLRARRRPAAAVSAVALQWGLGVALILALWPRWLTPAAILLLLVLAGLGYWGTATGRTEDCGCYNDLFTFSPLQSLLLDASYVALLAFSWWWGRPEGAWLWSSAPRSPPSQRAVS